MGNLILASKRKGKGGVIAFIILGSLIALFGVGLVILSLGSRGDEGTAGVVTGVLMSAMGGALFGLGGVKTAALSYSFVDIYSEGVKGRTLEAAGQNFELKFKEIQNVHTAVNIVTIHANHATYKCFALNAEEIRSCIMN